MTENGGIKPLGLFEMSFQNVLHVLKETEDQTKYFKRQIKGNVKHSYLLKFLRWLSGGTRVFLLYPKHKRPTGRLILNAAAL